MDFAVIKIAGKQQLVKVGDVIAVNANPGEVGKSVAIKDVLLMAGDKDIKVGTPLVDGAKVTGEVTFVGKGDKLYIRKFKAKSRYRRTTGFRPQLSKLKIVSIR
ncbi:MAG: 50S ribosomal protein L21 [Patescibacteria group bacterium]|nr:50S ribosomal protein L21 [Patescibacteria group bacterium]MCL5431743.1 50S ribosomal protein L21 [Patescibacteria group bacterium]